MRIGLLAPEYSAAFGGMPEYARRLAEVLAGSDEVTVYAYAGAEMPAANGVLQRAVLSRELGASLRAIQDERQDVWYATNASLFALAPHLDAPFAGFLNGNDVLHPWLSFERKWLDRLRAARLAWRLEPGLRARLTRRDVRRGLARARAIIANSTNTAALLSQEFPGFEEKVRVIPPGVGDEYFQEHGTRRAGGSGLRLLTVARLEHWTARKNVDGVLRALTLLPPGMVEQYDVVGDGDDRVRVERIARDLQLGNVSFRGSLPQDAILQLYREADLFVLCAKARRHDVEGFGIVYLEASAAGTPVLCSRAGGSTDAVRAGVNGLVTDDSEPEGIAQGIRTFVERRRDFTPERVRAFAEAFRWPVLGAQVRGVLARAVHDE